MSASCCKFLVLSQEFFKIFYFGAAMILSVPFFFIKKKRGDFEGIGWLAQDLNFLIKDLCNCVQFSTLALPGPFVC